MNKYIVDGDFVEIVTDKFTDQGVKRGRLAYVAGTRVLPISENDPYTQRINFLVHLVEDEHVITKEGIYLMDPISLAKVDEGKQKRLTEILKEDFDLEKLNSSTPDRR